MTNRIVQHLSAKNDTNGNPRRLYMAYNSETLELEAIWDEGYRGVPSPIRGLPRLPEVKITPKEYRDWLNHELFMY